MNQPEMEISNANYDAAAFLARIHDLLDRDEQLLGPIVQRSILTRTHAGVLAHAITRIDVLPALSHAGVEEVLDYGKLKYIREILTREALQSRLASFLAKGFEVGDHQFSTTSLGFSDHYQPSKNLYSEWPSRIFYISFNSGSVQPTYEPLLHASLKSFSSAADAIREFLDFKDYGMPDARLGHILLCIPNLNACISKLKLYKNILQMTIDGASEAESLKLDLNYKSKTDSISIEKRLESKEAEFKLSSLPTQIRIWLISIKGFLADFHEENERYSTGANAVLPKQEQDVLAGSWDDSSLNTQSQIEPSRIFLVHGHNVVIKESVAQFVKKLNMVPVILHEQANEGRTIIEKFEFHSDVGFAIVLLTGDDEGRVKGNTLQPLNWRARQNVVFELGYFTAKLGRKHVVCILEDGVEIPSDFQGVVYISFDPEGFWKFQLVRELKAAGFQVDANQAV